MASNVGGDEGMGGAKPKRVRRPNHRRPKVLPATVRARLVTLGHAPRSSETSDGNLGELIERLSRDIQQYSVEANRWQRKLIELQSGKREEGEEEVVVVEEEEEERRRRDEELEEREMWGRMKRAVDPKLEVLSVGMPRVRGGVRGVGLRGLGGVGNVNLNLSESEQCFYEVLDNICALANMFGMFQAKEGAWSAIRKLKPDFEESRAREVWRDVFEPIDTPMESFQWGAGQGVRRGGSGGRSGSTMRALTYNSTSSQSSSQSSSSSSSSSHSNNNNNNNNNNINKHHMSIQYDDDNDDDDFDHMDRKLAVCSDFEVVDMLHYCSLLLVGFNQALIEGEEYKEARDHLGKQVERLLREAIFTRNIGSNKEHAHGLLAGILGVLRHFSGMARAGAVVSLLEIAWATCMEHVENIHPIMKGVVSFVSTVLAPSQSRRAVWMARNQENFHQTQERYFHLTTTAYFTASYYALTTRDEDALLHYLAQLDEILAPGEEAEVDSPVITTDYDGSSNATTTTTNAISNQNIHGQVFFNNSLYEEKMKTSEHPPCPSSYQEQQQQHAVSGPYFKDPTSCWHLASHTSPNFKTANAYQNSTMYTACTLSHHPITTTTTTTMDAAGSRGTLSTHMAGKTIPTFSPPSSPSLSSTTAVTNSMASLNYSPHSGSNQEGVMFMTSPQPSDYLALFPEQQQQQQQSSATSPHSSFLPSQMHPKHQWAMPPPYSWTTTMRSSSNAASADDATDPHLCSHTTTTNTSCSSSSTTMISHLNNLSGLNDSSQQSLLSIPAYHAVANPHPNPWILERHDSSSASRHSNCFEQQQQQSSSYHSPLPSHHLQMQLPSLSKQPTKTTTSPIPNSNNINGGDLGSGCSVEWMLPSSSSSSSELNQDADDIVVDGRNSRTSAAASTQMMPTDYDQLAAMESESSSSFDPKPQETMNQHYLPNEGFKSCLRAAAHLIRAEAALLTSDYTTCRMWVDEAEKEMNRVPDVYLHHKIFLVDVSVLKQVFATTCPFPSGSHSVAEEFERRIRVESDRRKAKIPLTRSGIRGAPSSSSSHSKSSSASHSHTSSS